MNFSKFNKAFMINPSRQPREVPFWPGVILVAIGMPFCFWLRFGRINGYALGFTGFLLLLLFAIHFLPKLNNKYGAEQEAIKVKPGRFDVLGVVWLLAIPFAPFLLWLVDSLFTMTIVNWKLLSGMKVLFCIVIPCVCVLPLLRFLRGKAAPYALLILVIGTGFPVTFGLNSLVDLVEGLKQEKVEITSVKRVHSSWRSKDIVTDILEIELADGRLFEANAKQVDPSEGEADIDFLAHQKVILGSK
jgi:hypothetical protein